MQESPLGIVGLHEESRIVHLLGQAETLLRQFLSDQEFCTHQIKGKQPPQHWEEIRGYADLLTQSAGSRIRVSHFWCCKAFCHHESRAKANLQDQFLPSAFRRVWQGPQ